MSTGMFTVSPLPENLGKVSATAIGLELILETASQILTNIIYLEID